jgi:hypothetical protein
MKSPAATLRKIVAFVAVVELVTGLVLTIDPAIVGALLVGADNPNG